MGPLGLVVSLEPAPHTAAALAANLEQHRQWRAQLGKEVGTNQHPLALVPLQHASACRVLFWSCRYRRRHKLSNPTCAGAGGPQCGAAPCCDRRSSSQDSKLHSVQQVTEAPACVRQALLYVLRQPCSHVHPRPCLAAANDVGHTMACMGRSMLGLMLCADVMLQRWGCGAPLLTCLHGWLQCTITNATCLPCHLCCRAAGWSSLSPDDDEVVANMQAYLRSLLQEPSAATQQQQQQAMPSSTSLAVPPDSRGWSPTQRTLVSGAVGNYPSSTSCATVHGPHVR